MKNFRLFAIASMCLLAGAFKGVCDTLQFHYGISIFTDFANQQFWNPDISWMNKYADYLNGDTSDRYFLSKTVLVTFSDGWHALQFCEAFMWIAAIITALRTDFTKPAKLSSILTVIALFIIIHVLYTTGFTITYNWLCVKTTH